jgi:AcrR family transcriptional regulator
MAAETKKKRAKSRQLTLPSKPARVRKIEPAARREAILDAALSVFAERGYEAARLDDVAERAGVAKGTLYLYFADKEALFEEVIRGAASPVVERLSALAAIPDMPIAESLEALFTVFEKEVLGTKRKLLIRLVIAEGPRFPRIAEFYYRNVVGRIMPLIGKMAQRAAERGELPSDALARYPQLIAAPLLAAVIWDGLFSRISPLDVAGFLRAHREVLTQKSRSSSP